MRKVLAVVAVAAFATTASAQAGGGMKGMAGMDEQKTVTQEGPTPAGWSIRPDKPANPTTSVNFVAMGPGMHVTSGNTAAIYWNPANTASGTYTISASFGVRSIPLHDAIGLIWGGNDLSGDKESYGYFLVYGNGTFAVRHHRILCVNGRDLRVVHEEPDRVRPDLHGELVRRRAAVRRSGLDRRVRRLCDDRVHVRIFVPARAA